MTPVLEVSGVGKAFGGVAALAGVSLSAFQREVLGVIGPNGAGKTTLFDCLLGVVRPDAGRIRYLGRDLDGLGVHQRARLGIGRTFQRLELFPELTPREHLVVARRAHRGRRDPGHQRAVVETLALVGLESVADVPVDALGLGFGRLVELARALVPEPRLLLLDEPSSGLDRTETAAVAGVISQAARDRDVAVVLVEHDLDLVVGVADRLVVLDAGQVIAEGPPQTVMADPGVRRAYLGAPA